MPILLSSVAAFKWMAAGFKSRSKDVSGVSGETSDTIETSDSSRSKTGEHASTTSKDKIE